MGRHFYGIDIVHAHKLQGHGGIQLHNDLFGHLRRRVADAHRGGWIQVPLLVYGAGFYNGGVYIPKDAVFHLKGHLAQQQIRIFHLPVVDGPAHAGVGLIRKAAADHPCLQKGFLQLRAYGSPCDQCQSHGDALFGPLGYGHGHRFGVPRHGKAAGGHGHFSGKESGGLPGGHELIFQRFAADTFVHT